MTFRIQVDDWSTQMDAARLVRQDVFIIEQNIPVELEWDDMDTISRHAVAYDEKGTAIGTGRLLPDGHIGRMAVIQSARGAGIGGAILTALMQEAQKRGDDAVMLNAQIQAEPFYAKYGFKRQGVVFMEAGIEHIEMQRAFNL